MNSSLPLIETVRNIPHKSGVYIIKDCEGRIIYIGKAKDLQKRVSSYFHKTYGEAKIELLLQNAEAIETIITDNEIEALILESTLIKKHKPKFNIELKDNNKYPYIKITSEKYPRILKTRIKTDDSALYFGPYPNVKYINRTIKTITDIFPIIRCKRNFSGKKVSAPCINYYLGTCVCPYLQEMTEQEYRKLIDQVILFLKGQNKRLLLQIKKEMLSESREHRYERALQCRDRYRAVQNILQEQKVSSLKGENEDIFGIAHNDGSSCITVLSRREGKIIGKRDFVYAEIADREELLEQFMLRFYENTTDFPSSVLLPCSFEGLPALFEYLRKKHGRDIRCSVPQKGLKKRLVELARKNALQKLQEDLYRYNPAQAGNALKTLLDHERIPRCIEAFDISTTLGSFSVASMVRFSNALPDRKNYRKYKIRYSAGQNDVEMIKEAVGRRYQRILNERKPLPDIVLVDGGPAQLNGALEVLEKLEVKNLPVIGLAKKEEDVYIAGMAEPVRLEKNSDALRLLMAVRNEAHRFAHSYHVGIRSRQTTLSRLKNIPGIGNERARLILESIAGSPDRVSLEDLLKLKGLGKKRAADVLKVLQAAGLNDMDG